MKLINPRVTVQNTDAKKWLVSFENDFGGGEIVAFTVALEKPSERDQSIVAMQYAAVARALDLLRCMSATHN